MLHCDGSRAWPGCQGSVRPELFQNGAGATSLRCAMEAATGHMVWDDVPLVANETCVSLSSELILFYF